MSRRSLCNRSVLTPGDAQASGVSAGSQVEIGSCAVVEVLITAEDWRSGHQISQRSGSGLTVSGCCLRDIMSGLGVDGSAAANSLQYNSAFLSTANN